MRLFRKVFYGLICLQLLCLLILVISVSACKSRGAAGHKIISDTSRIKKDLSSIIGNGGYRNYENLAALNATASYICSEFNKTGDTVYNQVFQVESKKYMNVVCVLNPEVKRTIIIGAHYDVCGEQEGADDNASGVAGLLELARLLHGKVKNSRIEFVAYTLEEPPFFSTKNMGSYVHAEALSNSHADIIGMICLEMIGYFNDSAGSQQYPLDIMKTLYGDKGDYITVVNKFWNGSFPREISNLMLKNAVLPTNYLRLPTFLPGIDFSDHRNYWKFGFDALMVTNTSFYRNRNYHKNSDKLETLDIRRLALTVDEVFLALNEYCRDRQN